MDVLEMQGAENEYLILLPLENSQLIFTVAKLDIRFDDLLCHEAPVDNASQSMKFHIFCGRST